MHRDSPCIVIELNQKLWKEVNLRTASEGEFNGFAVEAAGEGLFSCKVSCYLLRSVYSMHTQDVGNTKCSIHIRRTAKPCPKARFPRSLFG